MSSQKPSLTVRIGFASVILFAITVCASVPSYGQSQSAPSATATPVMKLVGTVKAINGDEITLQTDSGTEVSILIQDSTRILRSAPGQTSLKDATSMTLQKLQVGDRMLIRGTASDDGKSVVAISAVVMKQSDVAARQQQQREDWQKRGVGGLVKSIDASTGTIQVSVTSFAATINITVTTSKSTVIRRYSPDSVKFDDAKPGTLEQIHAGDQLRARGTHSPDGTSLDAEEVVSGTFRNIAGTVSSTDPGQNTISVMDLITKKPLIVKITPDSQLRQLPAMFAQRIAMRLKGGSGDQPNGESANGGSSSGAATNGVRPTSPAGDGSAAPGAGMRSGGGYQGGGYPGGGGGGYSGGGANRSGGPPDFQQMLSRLPTVTLADLHKGDAVMIVATEGSGTSSPTAITLLSGVEPILTASPNSGRAATLLSPWNLGSSAGGDAATQ
jgi:Domain of unknown function (DUF5666)